MAPTTPPAALLTALLLAATPAAADLRLDGGPSGWDEDRWRAQVDGVMGGRSSGYLGFRDSGAVMEFSGYIVTDGGGFSSVRKRLPRPLDLTPYAGITVELETTDAFDAADPPLGLHLQLHDTSSWYGYSSAFAVPLTSAAGETVSVYLPLESFDRATWIGRTCEYCEIDFTRVNEIDVYVLFQEGWFDVRVKSITAVDDPQSFLPPRLSIGPADVQSLLQSTISSGAKLYNYNYRELCIAVYRSTLNTLLASNYDGPAAEGNKFKGMICQGLRRAKAQSGSKTKVAFTLRYIMDALLEELGALDPARGRGWRPDPDASESLGEQCRNILPGDYFATEVATKNETSTDLAESNVTADASVDESASGAPMDEEDTSADAFEEDV